MKKFLSSSLIRALLFLILSSSWGYGEEMMKIVYRYDRPEMPSDPFAGKQRTLYFYGPTKVRMEEEPDLKMRLQRLLISNERNLWMINLLEKAGQHIIKNEDDAEFHFPVLLSVGREKLGRVRDFQIGHELAFMEKRKVEPKKTTFEGKDLLLYECVEEGLTLRLYVLPETKVPATVTVSEGDKLLMQIRYDEYVASLPGDDSLFTPSADIRIKEPPAESRVSAVFRQMRTFYLSPSLEKFTQYQADAASFDQKLSDNPSGPDLAIPVSIAAIARKNNWPVTGTGKSSGVARNILEGKSKLAQYIWDDSVVDTGKVELWWICYFGSGDTEYLLKILKYAGEPLPKEDGPIIQVMNHASESFKANCLQDKTVMEFARSQIEQASSPKKKQFLMECVGQKPEEEREPERSREPQG